MYIAYRRPCSVFITMTLAIFIGTSAYALDCNVNAKQMSTIRSLLCGKPDASSNGCFEQYQTKRFALIAAKSQTLRACGYETVAVDSETSMKEFAKIIEPLAECIGQTVNLQRIVADQISEAKKAGDPDCGDARKAEALQIIKDNKAQLDAMKDPSTVRDRLYFGILGLHR